MIVISMAGVEVLADVVVDVCFTHVRGQLPVKRINLAEVTEERWTFPAQQVPCMQIMHSVTTDTILGL